MKPFLRIGDYVYKRASQIELHVWDFDGTLFRCPLVPDWWEGNNSSWFIRPESLDRPCVPHQPDETWWIMDNVYAARESFSNPNVYSVLLTGREEDIFCDRIHELLKQQGLDFDEIHLCDRENKLRFKLETLSGILGGSYSKVCFWDDQQDDLEMFTLAVESTGRAVDTHPIAEDFHAAICGPEHYTSLLRDRVR